MTVLLVCFFKYIIFISNSDTNIEAPLQADDVDFGFWVDRHGTNNTYFTGMYPPSYMVKTYISSQNSASIHYTGSNHGYHVCDCHYEEEGCVDEETRGNTCNCDANLPIPLYDTGVLTNMTALPVTKLYFGRLFLFKLN